MRLIMKPYIRIFRVIACISLCIPVFACVWANAVDVQDELNAALDTYAVERAAKLPAGINIASGVDTDMAFSELYGKLRTDGRGILKDALKSAALIVLISYLCAAAQTLAEPACDAAKLAGTAAIAIVALRPGSELISHSMATLRDMQDFSNVLLPVLASTASAAGSFTASAVKYSAAALFLNILTNSLSNILLPLTCVFAAASVGEAATGSKALSGAASLIKFILVTLLTALVLAFTVYIGMTGLISGSADAAAVKTAKTAISTMLPIAGSIASDAASSVLAAASVIKNGVGAFGLIAVMFLCAVPFLANLVRYLVFKGASSLTAESADGTVGKLVKRMGEVYGILATAIGVAALIQFISIFSFMGVSGI